MYYGRTYHSNQSQIWGVNIREYVVFGSIVGSDYYGMVWYGMVWYGMAWYGMVWYSMVWYGMVWYGMATRKSHYCIK